MRSSLLERRPAHEFAQTVLIQLKEPRGTSVGHKHCFGLLILLSFELQTDHIYRLSLKYPANSGQQCTACLTVGLRSGGVKSQMILQ